MEIIDQTTCLEILEDLVERTKLSKEEKDIFYNSINSPEGLEMRKRMYKEDIASHTLYDFKRNAKLQAGDRDGFNEYKIIGITDDGNLIVQYTGNIPWV